MSLTASSSRLRTGKLQSNSQQRKTRIHIKKNISAIKPKLSLSDVTSHSAQLAKKCSKSRSKRVHIWQRISSSRACIIRKRGARFAAIMALRQKSWGKKLPRAVRGISDWFGKIGASRKISPGFCQGKSRVVEIRGSRKMPGSALPNKDFEEPYQSRAALPLMLLRLTYKTSTAAAAAARRRWWLHGNHRGNADKGETGLKWVNFCPSFCPSINNYLSTFLDIDLFALLRNCFRNDMNQIGSSGMTNDELIRFLYFVAIKFRANQPIRYFLLCHKNR